MAHEASRAAILHELEEQAEVLVAHQLDLLAQLEGQLRAVHESMRRIGMLRAAKYRIGRALTNGERRDTLVSLASEVAAIETQIQTQQASCQDMQTIIRQMLKAAEGLRSVADVIRRVPEVDDAGLSGQSGEA
jgi:hypothetical protein